MIHFQSLTAFFWKRIGLFRTETGENRNETWLFRTETGESENESDEISDRLGGFTSPFFPQAENAVKITAQATSLIPKFMIGPSLSIFGRLSLIASRPLV